MTVGEEKDRLESIYGDRLFERLQEIERALVAAGFTPSMAACDMSDDESWWALTVEGNGLKESVSVEVRIAFSEDWDGEDGGVNFMLDVVAEGGRPIGGFAPYNYTPQVWVPRTDPIAMDARINLFLSGCDAGEVVALIERDAAREEMRA